MKDLQLNGMRELSFKEVEDVSGGSFLQFLLPAHTAAFSRDPIGGSSNSQLQYANSINFFRQAATTTAGFFGPKGIDFVTNSMVQQTPIFVLNDPWGY